MTHAPDNEQYCEPETIVHMPFAGALAGAGGKGAGGGGDGEGGGGGESCGGTATGLVEPQIVKPPLTTDPSVYQVIVCPAVIGTFAGPTVPLKRELPIMMRSQQLSVWKYVAVA